VNTLLGGFAFFVFAGAAFAGGATGFSGVAGSSITMISLRLFCFTCLVGSLGTICSLRCGIVACGCRGV
jgi:hypothetical protein